jgi:uncharacterized protein
MKLVTFVWIAIAVLFAAPVQARDDPDPNAFEIGERLDPAAAGASSVDGFRELTWDDLIPPDWLPEDLFEGLFDDADLDRLEDYDPRAIEIMERIREIWDAAPVVERLSGQRIRIPGFVVPLEGDGEHIREFLLVPYFGACIHVPPPPANQLIHVVPERDIPASWNMVPVWVSGVLTVARYDSELGTAGYQMRGILVEEYKE